MVFREEHRDNYTKIDNRILMEQKLSLAAKGLLITMLSLSDDWSYSTVGLASIVKESKNTIHRLLKELEDNNYLIRKSIRDEKGRFVRYDYYIYELPYHNIRDMDLPDMENRDIINNLNNKDEIDETLSSGYTNELIRRGYISKDDYELNRYDELFEKLKKQYGYQLIYMSTNYILRVLKSNKNKDQDDRPIEDKFNYLKVSLINNLEYLTQDVVLWDSE